MQRVSDRGKYPYPYINLDQEQKINEKAKSSQLSPSQLLPISGETNQTVEEITGAEVTDQNEDGLSHVCQAGPAKLSPDPLGAGDHIEEGEEHQGVGQNTNGLHRTNDWQVEAPEVRH